MTIPAHENAQAYTLLPHPLPQDEASRAILVSIRRMAVHGIRDASSANLLLSHYGLSAQRITILLRAMIVDLARAAKGNILLAPCCAPRMTDNEALILGALSEPDQAVEMLLQLLGTADCLRAATSMRTLSTVLIDIGKPIQQ